MTLQIFLHFFHHKFVTSLQSTSLPSAASALSLRRIGDALLLQRRSMTALCGPHPRHSPPTSTLIVAERRHSAITRYAERSAVCRDSARPCCRRAGGTPLLQSRSPTARAVTPSVNPRQRRGYTHRRTCAAERRRWHTPAMHLQRHRPAVHLSISTLSPDARSGEI